MTEGGRRLPLEDVRIIAVEQFGAGPFGSMQLADLGADVIKIEDPGTGGDVGRSVPPYAQGDEDGDNLFFEAFNRNKRSVSLDLSVPAGREVFEKLVRVSDAVYSNLRGDVPARLRIRYDDLAPVNAAIVCCSLSGFGMTGPRAAEPAYDYILQGMAGWMSLTGEPDGPPTKSGLSLVDFSGGLAAACALLAGVHAARRDGVGTDCDVSLFDTAIAMLSYPAVWHLTAGFEPVRTAQSAHPTLVPFQNFQTADGWIVVACPKEKFWCPLPEAIGRPELATDPRFATFADRHEHRGEVLGIIADALRRESAAHWLDVLTAAGVPCGPVNDVAAALADPQTAARGLVVETDHPAWGTVRQVAGPVRVGERRASHRRAPRRDEDADAILHDLLGYDAGAVARLAAAGAFGAFGAAHD
ncbi:MAG TPA: CoA transferase [Acidimicrobiia bacterium]|nr:CoA transferase [Acidimicrobiia bacterium]